MAYTNQYTEEPIFMISHSLILTHSVLTEYGPQTHSTCVKLVSSVCAVFFRNADFNEIQALTKYILNDHSDDKVRENVIIP